MQKITPKVAELESDPNRSIRTVAHSESS